VPTATIVAAADVTAAKPQAKAKARNNKVYVVRLAENPVVAYDGKIKGYAATKIRKGQKLDPDAGDVVRYKNYLNARHDALLNAVGGAKKIYSYG
jgi:hypothetical protein